MNETKITELINGLNIQDFTGYYEYARTQQNREEIFSFDDIPEGHIPLLKFVEFVQSLYSNIDVKDEELFIRCKEHDEAWVNHFSVVRVWKKSPEELEAISNRDRISAENADKAEYATYLKLKARFETK